MNTLENPLRIYEYGGTGRSGKGTIVSDLAKNFEGIATEETGADYRVVTCTLLEAGFLEREMNSDSVSHELRQIAPDEIADIVAERKAWVAKHGIASLYSDAVSEVVPSVGKVPAVRKAVKTGFRRRVEAIVNNDEHDILLVDGRNLAAVIASIPGTQLMLRTFVRCDAEEAGLREVMRAGSLHTPGALQESIARIKKRNQDDASRSIDPVIPDSDAIHYWGDETISGQETLTTARQKNDKDISHGLRPLITRKAMNTAIIRYGIAATAVKTGRQIIFDTTRYRNCSENPKRPMLLAARVMFEEAVALH